MLIIIIICFSYKSLLYKTDNAYAEYYLKSAANFKQLILKVMSYPNQNHFHCIATA